jgi:hypothetical protein
VPRGSSSSSGRPLYPSLAGRQRCHPPTRWSPDSVPTGRRRRRLVDVDGGQVPQRIVAIPRLAAWVHSEREAALSQVSSLHAAEHVGGSRTGRVKVSLPMQAHAVLEQLQVAHILREDHIGRVFIPLDRPAKITRLPAPITRNPSKLASLPVNGVNPFIGSDL